MTEHNPNVNWWHFAITFSTLANSVAIMVLAVRS